MKILLVDDDEMILKTVKYGLSEEGYKIITSSNGFEALKTIEKENPDLIISDISMPYLSGFELLSYLKCKVEKQIPVILITGLEEREIMMTAFKLGADDFITKPINMEQLSFKIKKLSFLTL